MIETFAAQIALALELERVHYVEIAQDALVTNLLNIARLQSGAIRLNCQWSMLEETIGSALAVSRRILEGRAVQVKVPPSLPLLQLDAVLMERLFANLLENAAK